MEVDLESIMLPFALIVLGGIIVCHIIIYILKRRNKRIDDSIE